jgi:RND family efflux transporter MFP subunit
MKATLTRSAFALLAILTAAGCGGGAEDAVVQKPINVRTLTVQASDLSEYLTITGTLQPVRGADVSTEESGVVQSIPHDKGARVQGGAWLVVLDRDLLEAQRRAAEAGLELAAYNDERADKLFAAKQISREERLSIRTRFQQAQAEADIARLRHERAAVRAPFGGVVADRYVEVGQLVGPGTPVARVVDPYVLELAGSVSEREIASVREGASALVTLEAFGETAVGRVHWVSLEADPRTGKFQVEIRVENPDLALRPGVVGSARVLRDTHRDAVVIPRDAVVQGPDGHAVFVVEETTAHLRSVTLGADQGAMTVVEEGLGIGERLIVRGQRELVDGSHVEVREEAVALDGSSADDPLEVRSAAALPPALTRDEAEEGAR